MEPQGLNVTFDFSVPDALRGHGAHAHAGAADGS